MLETTDCLKFPLKLTKARRSNPDVHHSSPCQQAQTSSKTFMLPVCALVLAHVRPRAPPNTVSQANLVIGSTALLSDHKPVSRGEGSLSIASAHSNYPFFSSFERPCARQDQSTTTTTILYGLLQHNERLSSLHGQCQCNCPADSTVMTNIK